MSKEQLKAFLDKAKGDTSLQEKLKVATDAEAVIAIAKEAGFSLSIDDSKKAQEDHTELLEKELESMSGGIKLDPSGNIVAISWADCGC